MSLQTEQATDLAAIFAELAETLTFGASTIPCSVTFREKGRKNEPGGFLDDFDATFTVRAADLPVTPPAVGNTITHRSLAYRIDRLGSGQTNVEIKYQCSAVNR